MRIRHLQTYLTQQGLLMQSDVELLRGMRIGIDAIHWIRSLPSLKDPWADATGGPPTPLYAVLDAQLARFQENGIEPIFVFEGMRPRSHMLFSTQLHEEMDSAWQLLAAGKKKEAHTKFTLATSRINSDTIWTIFHYLKSKGMQVFHAPYSADSQLALFVEEKYFDAVISQPALILFGVQRIILCVDFHGKTFSWLDQAELIAGEWRISPSAFQDACLLAGTEYCLTYPYLNVKRLWEREFEFGSAIDLIKDAGITAYIAQLHGDLRSASLEGICVCKTLIDYGLAMMADGCVHAVGSPNNDDTAESRQSNEGGNAVTDDDRGVCSDVQSIPAETNNVADTSDECINSGGATEELGEKPPPPDEPREGGGAESVERPEEAKPTAVAEEEQPTEESLPPTVVKKSMPADAHCIVGMRLPSSIYYLIAQGVLSRKLPTALSLGEWFDYSYPAVDSKEYRFVLKEIGVRRCRALGLVAKRLHPSFHTKNIVFARRTYDSNPGELSADVLSTSPPYIAPGISWNFTSADIEAEMKRQNVSKIDCGFCLKWHEHAEAKGNLFDATHSDEVRMLPTDNLNCLVALVHFILLEQLDYFTESGAATIFGSTIANTEPEFQEQALFALELTKHGMLGGDPLEGPPDRPFSTEFPIFRRDMHSAEDESSIRFLSRVMSLIPMNLNPYAMWNSDVDYDLSAFHTIVRILRRTLRQLTEASLASILLRDLQQSTLLPADIMNPLDPLLPCFVLSRNYMGIVAKLFLEYDPELDVTEPTTDEIAEGLPGADSHVCTTGNTSDDRQEQQHDSVLESVVSQPSADAATIDITVTGGIAPDTDTAAPWDAIDGGSPKSCVKESASSTCANFGSDDARSGVGVSAQSAGDPCEGEDESTTEEGSSRGVQQEKISSPVASPARAVAPLLELPQPEPQSLVAKFEAEVRRRFPCCVSPMQDLIKSIGFWRVIKKNMQAVSGQGEQHPLLCQTMAANEFLNRRIKLYDLESHPEWINPKP